MKVEGNIWEVKPRDDQPEGFLVELLDCGHQLGFAYREGDRAFVGKFFLPEPHDSWWRDR